tara:strand:- start:7927 stop:8283 length:357 start_codon:yes stop_codon:yes gene_type:complete
MVGTDIIEVSRIKKIIKDKGGKFLNRIYTKNEIDYCESKGLNKYQHYAGRFAAKEAIFKLVNYNNDSSASLIFKDIEILNKSNGSPYLKFHSKNLTVSSIYISISHIKKYATAVAVKR